MRVALVGAELEENLALRYIHAAVSTAGHEARIFDFHHRGRIEPLADQLAAWAPELVGLSMVFTARATEFLALAEALRERGYRGHLTAGGFFASLHAERLLADAPALDSVLHGEGEEALVDLLAHLGQLEQVAGLTRRLDDGKLSTRSGRPLPADLDARAWPTRPERFHSYQGLPIANLLAGRGCYAHCRFCSIDAWTRFSGGPRFRQRRVDALADELAWLYHARGVRLFNFHDDNFFHPRKADNLRRFSELKQRLVAHGVGRIGLQIKARPDSIDPEVVAALVELGVFRVFLGVESNSVNGLKALGRGIRREQNHLALRLLKEAGLHVAFNLLMFEPGCTLQDLGQNVDFIRAYPEVPLNFCRTEVYGGTPLESELAAQGRLLGSYLGYEYRIADEPAQRAWELAAAIFTPRNFTLQGSHHRAMAVDYEWKLLQHFRPRAATAALTRRARAFVREVNLDTVGLLDRLLDAAGSPGAAARQQAVAASLSAELLLAEARFARRASILLAELGAAALHQPLIRRMSRAAASAAAAALLLGTGCDSCSDTHMTEMAPAPRSREACSPKEVAKIETAVNREVRATLPGLMARNHLAQDRLTVKVKVDGMQTVSTAQPELRDPRSLLEQARLAQDVAQALVGVAVPGVRDLECVVTLYVGGLPGQQVDAGAPPAPARVPPDDTHFAEMAPEPNEAYQEPARTHMSEMAPRPIERVKPKPKPKKK